MDAPRAIPLQAPKTFHVLSRFRDRAGSSDELAGAGPKSAWCECDWRDDTAGEASLKHRATTRPAPGGAKDEEVGLLLGDDRGESLLDGARRPDACLCAAAGACESDGARDGGLCPFAALQAVQHPEAVDADHDQPGTTVGEQTREREGVLRLRSSVEADCDRGTVLA